MQLIQKVLEKEKTAIVLVPEISLTPQMLERFISRFGKEEIAILHSKLSIGERHDEWERIREGKAKIVIGARSAIFAPLDNIGIIIIDEEHDSSYKSETNPRYNAKEIAKKMAQENNIPLLLGSATPDIQTYYNTHIKSEKENIDTAKKTKITLLELTKRANNSSLPKVEIIDLKQELVNGNRSMLSLELYTNIEKNLQDKHQTILFLNRRGYSTFIMCRNCGYTVKCPNCNISLTYHSYEKKLKCHYCGHEEKLVTICPECHSDKIRYFGTGTQKLEQEIHKQFPNASTIRMDIDTVTKKNSHEEILNKFKNENIDILIGTQMVVKGHHFPNVTLVGVIAADSSLNIDDYRANERTFQILTQVAGRAGRENLPGKVIIQTYNPQNFTIQFTLQRRLYCSFVFFLHKLYIFTLYISFPFHYFSPLRGIRFISRFNIQKIPNSNTFYLHHENNRYTHYYAYCVDRYRYHFHCAYFFQKHKFHNRIYKHRHHRHYQQNQTLLSRNHFIYRIHTYTYTYTYTIIIQFIVLLRILICIISNNSDMTISTPTLQSIHSKLRISNTNTICQYIIIPKAIYNITSSNTTRVDMFLLLILDSLALIEESYFIITLLYLRVKIDKSCFDFKTLHIISIFIRRNYYTFNHSTIFTL